MTVDLTPMDADECNGQPCGWPRSQPCRRQACDHMAQVRGAYCHCCFRIRMDAHRRPEVMILCSSTRFSEAWTEAHYDLAPGREDRSHHRMRHEVRRGAGHHRRTEGGPGRAAQAQDRHGRPGAGAERRRLHRRPTRSEIEYAEWFEAIRLLGGHAMTTRKPPTKGAPRQWKRTWTPSPSTAGPSERSMTPCADVGIATGPPVKIAILQRGWVMVGYFHRDPDSPEHCALTDASAAGTGPWSWNWFA